jgi:hypothetical protein
VGYINKKGSQASLECSGAGEESRTLDLNLGKVALYQLSYSRICYITIISEKLHSRDNHSNRNHCRTGAGEESRTLDLNLGKVALYQLSYSRFVLLLCCFVRNRQAL